MARPDPRAEDPENGGAPTVEKVDLERGSTTPRHDPRAEDPESSGSPSIDKIAIPKTVGTALTATGGHPKQAPAQPEPEPEREPTRGVVTSVDPRVAEVEKLLSVNDWQAAAAKLGADVGKLPPTLALIVAIARNEAAKDGDSDARDLAFRCTASLMNMPEESEIVRILARRLLRKNPVRFGQRPAPPAKTSAFIVLITLALGGGIGWLLSSGMIQRFLPH